MRPEASLSVFRKQNSEATCGEGRLRAWDEERELARVKTFSRQWWREDGICDDSGHTQYDGPILMGRVRVCAQPTVIAPD